jgi:uncharacterized protein YktA (UPF0223 family)
MFSKILIRIAKTLGLNYFFNFVKRHSFLFYSILLILTNLIPVYGVFFLEWTTYEVIFLYWLENGVIGFFNIIKMFYAEGKSANTLMRPYMEYTTNPNVTKYKNQIKRKNEHLIPFFLIHYGGFFMIHGAFIMFIFRSNNISPIDCYSSSVAIFLISLVFVYLFSLIFDYFGKKQYKIVTKKSLFWSPYLRVVVIHLIILLGYALVGQKQLIIVFVIFKMVADLFMYGKDIPKQSFEESITIDDQTV